jgi:sulfur carrier protein ThiS
MSITVQIKLFATLRPYLPPDADSYKVDPGTTVRSLLETLGVPLDKAKLVFINGKIGLLDDQLQGGERLGVFPPVGGG